MTKGNTNSPWFPNVLKPGSTTSSPWFPDTYGKQVVKKVLKNDKKFGGPKDLDGDGVRNQKDCQPRNTMRQDRVMNIAKEGMGNLVSNLMENNRTPPKKPKTKGGIML